MLSWENPDDRVAIVQMNAELRHAQLELLSAQCATNQLRLRYSTAEIASYGQQDVLRKAIDAAASLNDFFASIKKQMAEPGALQAAAAGLSPQQIQRGTDLVLSYLQGQRDCYFASAVPLSGQQKTLLRPFFSPGILDRIKVVELKGARVENPAFYTEAECAGLTNLPPVRHMASLTFIDVVVFNDRMTERALFHGLVHAVQFQILGPERYADLFVRGFLRAGSHVTVPIETHAFALESRFAEAREGSFSVEEQVRLWIREGRY